MAAHGMIYRDLLSAGWEERSNGRTFSFSRRRAPDMPIQRTLRARALDRYGKV